MTSLTFREGMACDLRREPGASAFWRNAGNWLCAAGLMLLSACSTLPVINPDMAPTPARVQVDGPNGPLSHGRSQAVLARLAGEGAAGNIFERHLAVEQEVSGSPLVSGNRVRLLEDGPDTYRAMFAAIAAARDHINLETYIFDDDEIGQSFAVALIEKQRQGVQVNLIYDSVGTLLTPAAFLQNLRENGIHLLEFNPINPLTAKAGWQVNQRDHRKLLVIDGRTAFVGGTNISSVHSGGSSVHGAPDPSAWTTPWRDTHLHMEGPVVAEFQKLFLDTWERQKGDPLVASNFFPALPLQGREVVRAIGSSPSDEFSLIYVTLMSAINSAESEILLTNAYFVPDQQLLDALKAAVARGVDVQLMLAGVTDSALVFHAGRSHYHELLKAGVKIHERRDALMHSKTAVIDGVWSTVGSTNLDWRSFLHNEEVNAVVLGKEFGDQMRTAFERDVAQSDLITLEEWRKRPLDLRIRERFSRMWQYWL